MRRFIHILKHNFAGISNMNYCYYHEKQFSILSLFPKHSKVSCYSPCTRVKTQTTRTPKEISESNSPRPLASEGSRLSHCRKSPSWSSSILSCNSQCTKQLKWISKRWKELMVECGSCNSRNLLKNPACSPLNFQTSQPQMVTPKSPLQSKHALSKLQTGSTISARGFHYLSNNDSWLLVTINTLVSQLQISVIHLGTYKGGT